VDRAHLRALGDVAEPQRVRRRAEVERPSVEDAVDRAGERAPVARDRREREQDHALQPLRDLFGGQAAPGGVDAQRVDGGVRVGRVDHRLERGEVLGCLVHGPKPM
jgi:hypothetical protein